MALSGRGSIAHLPLGWLQWFRSKDELLGSSYSMMLLISLFSSSSTSIVEMRLTLVWRSLQEELLLQPSWEGEHEVFQVCMENLPGPRSRKMTQPSLVLSVLQWTTARRNLKTWWRRAPCWPGFLRYCSVRYGGIWMFAKIVISFFCKHCVNYRGRGVGLGREGSIRNRRPLPSKWALSNLFSTENEDAKQTTRCRRTGLESKRNRAESSQRNPLRWRASRVKEKAKRRHHVEVQEGLILKLPHLHPLPLKDLRV